MNHVIIYDQSSSILINLGLMHEILSFPMRRQTELSLILVNN